MKWEKVRNERKKTDHVKELRKKVEREEQNAGTGYDKEKDARKERKYEQVIV